MSMFKPFSLALLAFCVTVMSAGCQMNSAERQHIPTEVRTDAPAIGRPTLGMPIMLPESDVFIVPFTLDRPRRWLEDSDRFDTIGASRLAKSTYKDYHALSGIGMSRTVRWHNAVFQTKAGKGRLALDRRGLISRFEIVGPWIEEGEGDDKITRLMPKGILLLATVDDTDGDDQLTNADAHVLLAGDKDGGGLHPITPKGTQVWGTRYSEKHGLVLLMVVRDTNKDGLFTTADSAAPYTYKPGDPGTAKPLVDPSLVTTAETLLK